MFWPRVLQLKYKQSLKKDLYHLMPETIDTQFVRQQMEMLSEVWLLYFCFILRINTPAGLFSSLWLYFVSRSSTKKTAGKRWASTCTLCCPTPSTPSMLKSWETRRARWVHPAESPGSVSDSLNKSVIIFRQLRCNTCIINISAFWQEMKQDTR